MTYALLRLANLRSRSRPYNDELLIRRLWSPSHLRRRFRVQTFIDPLFSCSFRDASHACNPLNVFKSHNARTEGMNGSMEELLRMEAQTRRLQSDSWLILSTLNLDTNDGASVHTAAAHFTVFTPYVVLVCILGKFACNPLISKH